MFLVARPLLNQQLQGGVSAGEPKTAKSQPLVFAHLQRGPGSLRGPQEEGEAAAEGSGTTVEVRVRWAFI